VYFVPSSFIWPDLSCAGLAEGLLRVRTSFTALCVRITEIATHPDDHCSHQGLSRSMNERLNI
jgi:hypothetical protein